jgi:hypothetical protein
VVVNAKPGERVTPGQIVFEVASRDQARLAEATALLARAFEVGDEPPDESPLVLEEIA